MHTYSTLFLAAVIAIGGVTSLEVPANVKSFRDGLKAGSCKKPLATGFFAHNEGPSTFSYCGDHLEDSKIVYLQGAGGALADMDIDCDGIQKGPGDDGRCGSSSDTQSQTSFMDTLQGYGQGVKDLNAYVHPYVVFGNVGSKAGFNNYDPKKNNIKPLSLMAVVCGDKMFYGIWGDENGDDGAKAVIGEASISMATLCFGKSVNGNAGHDETDILYIAFAGDDAVPGKNAKWNAASVDEFSSSIKSLGDTLVKRIGGAGGVTGAEISTPSETTTKGPKASGPPTTLVTAKSIVPSVTSKASVPASEPTTEPTEDPTEEPTEDPSTEEPSTEEPSTGDCEWTGHCAGAVCKTENDCDGELVCSVGKCGV